MPSRIAEEPQSPLSQSPIPLRAAASGRASATTGAIVASVGIEAQAPHGGVFVFFAITNFLVWLLAIVIGAVVAGIAVTVAKSLGRPTADDVPDDAVDLVHAHVPTHATQPTTA